MLKRVLLGLGAVLLIFIIWVVYGLFFAEPASPPDSVQFSNGGLEISIDYSRPYKKGRLIFGEANEGALQPYGQYWRLGANAATEITFNKDVTFAGKPVSAGTYRIYAVPGKDAFEVTLNSETGVFFGVNEPDPSLDVLSVEAPVTIQDNVTEQFTIFINQSGSGGRIDFVWDNVMSTVHVAS
ncbi:MAG: DUF2911 domain-containing protein [Bacteroidota bacterium]